MSSVSLPRGSRGAEIFTIGYGNRNFDEFLLLLERYEITALCDVRSTPYSRRFEAFNRESLKAATEPCGVRYLFLGDLLGARPSDPNLYIGGRASYALMESSIPFQAGLERLRRGMQSFTIALMCAEKDPLDCHRAILVSRALRKSEPVEVRHITPSGVTETQDELERRLLCKYGLEQSSLLIPVGTNEAIATAYERRAVELAYDANADHGLKASR